MGYNIKSVITTPSPCQKIRFLIYRISRQKGRKITKEKKKDAGKMAWKTQKIGKTP